MKTKYLTLAGRHVIAQFALSTIPYYVMQSTLIPKGVCDLIDRKVKMFL